MNESFIHAEQSNNWKPAFIIMAILFIALSGYTIYNNAISSKRHDGEYKLIMDTRELLFGSLDDVDTLFLDDRIVVFNRPFKSRERVTALMHDDNARIALDWRKDETVEDVTKRLIEKHITDVVENNIIKNQ